MPGADIHTFTHDNVAHVLLKVITQNAVQNHDSLFNVNTKPQTFVCRLQSVVLFADLSNATKNSHVWLFSQPIQIHLINVYVHVDVFNPVTHIG